MAPRRKWIDKNTAQTFTLVHRPQHDPLIHDTDAPDRIFAETSTRPNKSGANAIRHRGDLEDEFGFDVRQNEGEAANHGVFYDDSQYDYMQHMRDIGEGAGGETVWLEAPNAKKDKGKQKLEDALRDLHVDDARSVRTTESMGAGSEIFAPEMLESQYMRPTSYQDQQNVPDALAGFQPDMDPRLREVLEALDDEAYVDDEEDIFAELAKDGYEIDQDEWEAGAMDDDDGWESDDTVTGRKAEPPAAALNGEAVAVGEGEVPEDHDWMKEYVKYKAEMKGSAKPKVRFEQPAPSSVVTGSSLLAGGKKKKRKGALTNPTSYSMTSASLARTEALTVLDERFDKIEESYAEVLDGDVDDGASITSGLTNRTGRSIASSQLPETNPAQFDSIMDEFLGSATTKGRRRPPKNASKQHGLQQLDELRRGLGPARISRTQEA